MKTKSMTTSAVEQATAEIFDGIAAWLPDDRPITGGDVRRALGQALRDYCDQGDIQFGCMLIWPRPDGSVKINPPMAPSLKRKKARDR